jgi:hypothetical protein
VLLDLISNIGGIKPPPLDPRRTISTAKPPPCLTKYRQEIPTTSAIRPQSSGNCAKSGQLFAPAIAKVVRNPIASHTGTCPALRGAPAPSAWLRKLDGEIIASANWRSGERGPLPVGYKRAGTVDFFGEFVHTPFHHYRLPHHLSVMITLRLDGP